VATGPLGGPRVQRLVRSPWRLLPAVAAGGAAGALLRHLLGELAPDGGGFPWTTFGINVGGALLLGLLPALTAARHRPTLVAALGPGVLGGFTTLSTYAEQSRALLAEGDGLLALGYLAGTLAACVAAVAATTRWTSAAGRAELAAEGGEQ
jgi:CrcB protein